MQVLVPDLEKSFSGFDACTISWEGHNSNTTGAPCVTSMGHDKVSLFSYELLLETLKSASAWEVGTPSVRPNRPNLRTRHKILTLKLRVVTTTLLYIQWFNSLFMRNRRRRNSFFVNSLYEGFAVCSPLASAQRQPTIFRIRYLHSLLLPRGAPLL